MVEYDGQIRIVTPTGRSYVFVTGRLSSFSAIEAAAIQGIGEAIARSFEDGELETKITEAVAGSLIPRIEKVYKKWVEACFDSRGPAGNPWQPRSSMTVAMYNKSMKVWNRSHTSDYMDIYGGRKGSIYEVASNPNISYEWYQEGDAKGVIIFVTTPSGSLPANVYNALNFGSDGTTGKMRQHPGTEKYTMRPDVNQRLMQSLTAMSPGRKPSRFRRILEDKGMIEMKYGTLAHPNPLPQRKFLPTAEDLVEMLQKEIEEVVEEKVIEKVPETISNKLESVEVEEDIFESYYGESDIQKRDKSIQASNEYEESIISRYR